MSFSLPSGNDLLSFSPETVDESTYYDSLILKNRAKLEVLGMDGKPKGPKSMKGVSTLILAYNPSELSISRSVAWSSEKTEGNTSQLHYGGGGEDTLSVPVLLDGSEWDAPDDGGGSIVPHLQFLHAIATPFKQDSDTASAPAVVQFVWGDMSFIGVITKVASKLEMFNNKGNPMRATVTLDFKGVFMPESPTKGIELIMGALEKPEAAGGGGKTEDTEEGD